MKLTFRCYTCNIFRAIYVLQCLRKHYTKRNILRLKKTVKDLKPSSVSEPNEPKRIVLFMLPFSGVHSVQIRNQIKLFSSTYPHIQIRCIFRPMQRLSAFFRFSDRIPLGLGSRIAYKYKCQCCNAWDFGKTVRHFHKRISEHMGISVFTGKPLSKPPFSNICDHHHASGHPISPDDLSILSTCSSTFELLLRESLLISKLKTSPKLCKSYFGAFKLV